MLQHPPLFYTSFSMEVNNETNGNGGFYHPVLCVPDFAAPGDFMSGEKTWGGKRAGAGRPKGSLNKKPAAGRKTVFASTTISGSPEEIAAVKEKAAAAGKSVSRFLIELALNAEESRALP